MAQQSNAAGMLPPALYQALQGLSVTSTPPSASDWLFDTGASSHMTSNSGMLSTIHPSNSRIVVGNGADLAVQCAGTTFLPNASSPLRLNNVLVSPALINNLISVRSLTRDNSVSVEFDPFGFSIKDFPTQTVLLRSNSKGDLYPLRAATTSTDVILHATIDLWHARLGHPERPALSRILGTFDFTCKPSNKHSCHACHVAKHVRLPFSDPNTISIAPFCPVHCDLWTSPVTSSLGFQFYLVLLDDYSHYAWTFPLRCKSDVFPTLVQFYAFAHTQFGRSILSFQTNNGKEFDNAAFRSLLADRGSVLRLTCPYTSSQNGRTERILQTLNNCVRAMLIHASMPPTFWPDTLNMATHLINHRPCAPRLHATSYSLLFGVPPDY